MLNSCYARVVLYHPIHLSRLVSTLESLECSGQLNKDSVRNTKKFPLGLCVEICCNRGGKKRTFGQNRDFLGPILEQVGTFFSLFAPKCLITQKNEKHDSRKFNSLGPIYSSTHNP